MEVKRISYEDTKPFILNIHYARRMSCIRNVNYSTDNPVPVNKDLGVVIEVNEHD